MDDATAQLVLRYVAVRFPRATGVVVAGSTAAGERTATSDIDLLVILPVDPLSTRTSLARTDLFEGEAIEVFAYTPPAFRDWAGRGFAEHRPVIAHMLVEGVALRLDDGAADLRDWAAARLAEGPRIGAHELDLLRYAVTDLVDDLAAIRDPFEETVVRVVLIETLARFLLLAHGNWIGSGKWLVRRLRRWDEGVATDLGAAAADSALAVDVVDRYLRPWGGRLQDGFER
jgi:predicted nucleotidyltransferase